MKSLLFLLLFPVQVFCQFCELQCDNVIVACMDSSRLINSLGKYVKSKYPKTFIHINYGDSVKISYNRMIGYGKIVKKVGDPQRYMRACYGPFITVPITYTEEEIAALIRFVCKRKNIRKLKKNKKN